MTISCCDFCNMLHEMNYKHCSLRNSRRRPQTEELVYINAAEGYFICIIKRVGGLLYFFYHPLATCNISMEQ